MGEYKLMFEGLGKKKQFENLQPHFSNNLALFILPFSVSRQNVLNA